MIYEMAYWQRELSRSAAALKRHTAQRRWTDRSNASVERHVMVGFYIVRKMVEAFQPPPVVPEYVEVISYRRNSRKLSKITWPDIVDAFDLKAARTERIDVRHLCNQVIHSHFFSCWLDMNGQLRGVFLSSDRDKDKRIYRVSVNAISDLFETIGQARRRFASMSHFYPEHNWIEM